MREYTHDRHPAEGEFDEILDAIEDADPQIQIVRMQNFRERYPEFFDAYNHLVISYWALGKKNEASAVMEDASRRALSRVLDRKGKWPDRLRWSVHANRPLIRVFFNQAIQLWEDGKSDAALDILRPLFRADPEDHLGARYLILGLLQGLSREAFNERFSGPDGEWEQVEWFQTGIPEFSADFDWWLGWLNSLSQAQLAGIMGGADEDWVEGNEKWGHGEVEDVVLQYIARFWHDDPEKTPHVGTFQKLPPIHEPEEYQLKITIKETKPPVWRRVLVSSTSTFADLHEVIQTYFDWDGYHLHAFDFPRPKGKWRGISIGGLAPDGTRIEDHIGYDYWEDEVTLGQLLTEERPRCTYTYDFGDNWEHRVQLEAVRDLDPDIPYPVCIKGRQAPPPEDSGGVWGFQNFREALTNPRHPDHEEMVDWAGEGALDWDPDDFVDWTYTPKRASTRKPKGGDKGSTPESAAPRVRCPHCGKEYTARGLNIHIARMHPGV